MNTGKIPKDLMIDPVSNFLPTTDTWCTESVGICFLTAETNDYFRRAWSHLLKRSKPVRAYIGY